MFGWCLSGKRLRILVWCSSQSLLSKNFTVRLMLDIGSFYFQLVINMARLLLQRTQQYVVADHKIVGLLRRYIPNRSAGINLVSNRYQRNNRTSLAVNCRGDI